MVQDSEKYLVTMDEFFIAPDGDSYKAAWGICKILNIDDVFEFKVIRPSTNWYLKIGSDGKEVIAAGCQIHYAVRCPEKPSDKNEGLTYHDPNDHSIHTMSRIYIAE